MYHLEKKVVEELKHLEWGISLHSGDFGYNICTLD